MRPAIAALPRPRDVLDAFGIYVHVPFCAHRCWYCDFNAYAGLDHLADAYMDAVIRDVTEGLSAPDGAGLDARPAVTSIFIGGGTPSLVDARHIVRVLDAIRASWTVEPRAEVTIECNPESVDRAKLESYLAAGVNRISFGVQSLDDELLARLGRTHDAGTAVNALRMARSAGFDDVSADLIFGIPGETHEAWLASLEGVLACAPTHESGSGLTYEEGTPLAAWKRLGKVVAVPDDEVAARWDAAEAMLTSAGLQRYEISNWSRPGRRCCHNDLYWRCGEYIGVGA
ncbi:MAG: radical SAM family heme chaperone HemW, partial [Actinomycetota bacterium]